MGQINRGVGSTDTERYLARLADLTFLNLWSYPNPFNDRGATDKCHGKELCDLLVVCGDDVLVFSDKSISWPNTEDVTLAWSRWYRSAVEHSVRQLRGAERWIKRYPDRIFIDPSCTARLPLQLPAPDTVRVHLIAIALGAQTACAQHHGDVDGSLMVAGHIVGGAHTDPTQPEYQLFSFGDVAPDGTFVHVFDETALDLVMREADTISDFVCYLDHRAKAIREKRIFLASSEAEMLACYLSNEDEDGKHLFPLVKSPDGEIEALALFPGGYEQYTATDGYREKQNANRVSYGWDRLITNFTDNILGGTSVAINGSIPAPELAERAVRGMALENRTMRRALAEAFFGALTASEHHGQSRFARVILPKNGAADPECAYVFLIMAFRDQWLIDKGYDAYREIRTSTLGMYADVVLYDNRHLKRVVGIALDASPNITGRKGGSEDVMLLERLTWTSEAERHVEELRERFEILLPERTVEGRSTTNEYPVPLSPRNASFSYPASDAGNRKQRRAEEAKRRRSKRRK